jgi:hypothetical protein
MLNWCAPNLSFNKINMKQMAFDMGYSIEGVRSIMERFIEYHQLIRYNPDTTEIAIKNWGMYYLHKAGQKEMDGILTEIKEVEDTTLLKYVSLDIRNRDIRSLFESFSEQLVCEEMGI